MARIFDVIEYVDPSGREIVHRIPEQGSGDFRLGSQLIVRENQVAVFFRDGKALDTFGPGRHTISTANIPLLVNLLSIPFSGQTPFKAEVYFVNMREFLDQKWGTPEPIPLRDKELGLVRLRAFGTYSMQVADPQLFVNKIVGGQGLYDTTQITNFLRSIIVSKLVDLLGEVQASLFDLPRLYEEIGAGVRAKAQDDFANTGIALKTLYVSSISPTEETSKAIDERAAMGAIGNMQAYIQFKAARAMGDAAAAGGEAGSLAGAGVGLGAGVGIGAAMAGAITEAMKGAREQAAPTAAETVACPQCGTANPVGAKFCNNCGAKLSGTTACPNCGHENPPGAKFCNNCGTKLT
ncbi:MAG: SPFH domain-containing protein [Chloroflexi bacterium]|nr:SPFH domain-containing protein [Chloroflexota bacterium]